MPDKYPDLKQMFDNINASRYDKIAITAVR